MGEEITREFALDFVRKAHAGQKRKDGKDYITHLEAVAKLAEVKVPSSFYENGEEDTTTKDDLYIIGLLHDVLEDTDVEFETLKDQFGYYIADVVRSLSRKSGETYFDFIQRIISDAEYDIVPLYVKMSDLEHNMSDLSEGSMKDKYRFAHHMISQEV